VNTHYTGSSVSRPVLIFREDGTLARRLDFNGSAVQDVQSTDVAVFLQDRVQPSTRWFLEGAAPRSGRRAGRWNVTRGLARAVC